MTGEEYVARMLADAREHVDAANRLAGLSKHVEAAARLQAAQAVAIAAAATLLGEIVRELRGIRSSIDELKGYAPRDDWPALPDAQGLGEQIDRAMDDRDEQNMLADDERHDR